VRYSPDASHLIGERIVLKVQGRTKFNPDSAVAVERKREAQSFRSKVDGFLPLSRHRSAVLRGDDKPHRNDERERKMTLKLHSRTPSLLQDSTSLTLFPV
jgi:hypothetical protein